MVEGNPSEANRRSERALTRLMLLNIAGFLFDVALYTFPSNRFVWVVGATINSVHGAWLYICTGARYLGPAFPHVKSVFAFEYPSDLIPRLQVETRYFVVAQACVCLLFIVDGSFAEGSFN